METILKIEEIENHKLAKDDWNSYEGFKVATDKQEIFLLVSDGASCCEQWGQIVSEDDLTDFIGAELLNLTTTDIALNTKMAEKQGSNYLDCGDIMFMNLETNKGTLQFAVYNAHNGYYGHTGRIISNQLNLEVTL